MDRPIAVGHNLYFRPYPKTVPSYYYNYEFVSPEDLYSEIKEEMRSYFNTGILDDTMFPIYTDKALRKLGRSGLKIDEAALELKHGMAELPPDFKYVRELWMCANINYYVKGPSAIYTQEKCVVTPYGDFDRCNPCSTCPDDCTSTHMVYYKETGAALFSFSVGYLMRPGNLTTRAECFHNCKNFGSDSINVFDIRDRKVITNISDGVLYLVYYKEERDENDAQLIPDNYFIGEYIKSFIKWKLYEQLYNDVTDETFNQIERKYQMYKQEYNDNFILADAEVKKQTVYQKNLSIKRTKRRLNKYIIP